MLTNSRCVFMCSGGRPVFHLFGSVDAFSTVPFTREITLPQGVGSLSAVCAKKERRVKMGDYFIIFAVEFYSVLPHSTLHVYLRT